MKPNQKLSIYRDSYKKPHTDKRWKSWNLTKKQRKIVKQSVSCNGPDRRWYSVKFFSGTMSKSQALGSHQNKRISSKSSLSPQPSYLALKQAQRFSNSHIIGAMFPCPLSSSGARGRMLWVEHLKREVVCELWAALNYQRSVTSLISRTKLDLVTPFIPFKLNIIFIFFKVKCVNLFNVQSKPFVGWFHKISKTAHHMVLVYCHNLNWKETELFLINCN